MRSVLIAAVIALAISIMFTPIAIRVLQRRGFGQEIRVDGPQHHMTKKGTPTMGGAVIVLATVVGYFGAYLFLIGQGGGGPTASGLLLIYLLVGLGVVGFLDDYISIRNQRNLGLNKTAKLVGQLVIGVSFAVLALQFRNANGLTPGSPVLSFVRDIAPLTLGTVGFVAFALLLISAFSNAVNFTDGLDGLASGASVMVFGSYLIVSFWQFGHDCARLQEAGCYSVRDALDITLIAAAAMGACFGFLWWNASPARIIMGDTGSLSLGGLMAGLAIFTRTELLLVVLGGLFVVVAMSVTIQILVFRLGGGRRIFRMAPIHHHFELAGWTENTVVVRFWIVTGMAVAFGLGLFYADWLSLAELE
ncbi:MAG: phospho-N-acetylmuramoyl-pentapeptide-transferase [Geodermatophilaceae bacterium]|nr:phospho-N-acetylmuramoyl-pentapeptide-transferase [Geodermatophilaceae bacterium]